MVAVSLKNNLLKILSYVLEDKEYEGRKLSEIFANKADDELLRGNIQKATRIPSESILFNIDNKAEIASKEQPDAVLSVFYRVFYEHMGFFGAKPHVGDFEFWLWQEGKYDDFRQAFDARYEKPWTEARRQYFLPKVINTTAEVLSELMDGQPEEFTDILKTFQRDHSKVIDDFCRKVHTYIQAQPPGFRLNFFVDEIGQYISDNTKLMLNLQTIAETLAVQSKGQAWVLVTSQQDMEGVVGELNDSARNDFSRIQDRFRNRIPLTSASVDEVIEKRLLAKKEAVVPELKQLWGKEEANLATILRFAEVGIQLPSYRGEADFVRKYPFVNYQFDLFQSCIRALSGQGAFEGRHASVGERSMLGVFKEVLMELQGAQLGRLVPFDQLFEGIRSTIKGEVQAAVTLAERNLDNPLAIRVLKALFMVKYYRQFSATARNLSILLIDDIHIDVKAHEEAVEEALNLLEQQVFVQRNGEVYEFLTNEEKDIEREIKETDIDPGSESALVGDLIFGDILRDNRLRYEDNKQDYAFMGMVDDQRRSGRQQELILEVITPEFVDYDNAANLQARTMANNTKALFLLPHNKRLIPDARMFLKTERYLRHNRSTGISPRKQLIHQEKGQQNTERRRKLIETLRRDLGRAEVYLGPGKLELTPSEDGKNLVARAFQHLIRVAYPNLRMLGTRIYSEESVKNALNSRQDQLFGESPDALNEAEQEVLQWITRRQNQHERTHVQDVLDYYAHQPNGWYDYATLTMLARLLRRSKLEAWRSNVLLEGDALQGGLLNSRQRSAVLLEPQRAFDNSKVQALQELYRELFDESCPESEPRAVARAFRQNLEQATLQLKDLLRQQSNYPFLGQLQPAVEAYERIGQRDAEQLLDNPAGFADDLLDAKEDTVTPLLGFMHGEQVKIYDKVRDFWQGDQSNRSFVEVEQEMQAIEALLQADRPYRGALLRNAKAAMEQVRARILEQLQHERTRAANAITAERDRLQQRPEFGELTETQQQKLLQPFEQILARLPEERFIFQLRQLTTEAGHLYTDQVNQLLELLTPQVQEPPPGGETGSPEPTAPRPRRFVNAGDITVADLPREIATPDDLEQYLDALRRAYQAQLEQGNVINL